MNKTAWDSYWKEVERTSTPETIDEPKREAREMKSLLQTLHSDKVNLQNEHRTMRETMRLHLDGLRRCEKRIEEIENSIDTVNRQIEKNELPFAKWHRERFGHRNDPLTDVIGEILAIPEEASR